ncbi:uncharacterized protein BDZ99DRAFT_485052 [Mytilinidion resinicola]|uniref:Kinetochore protein SPC25 n=1 Tax=Mytilinidion resinicola TaxID=574789 RepID=A0A6A6Z5Y6_9PEZI|nr:uncharacterized protein BDZ99DRAFT_485052 [Mytilinidion resinicola]KAF2816440.1 hypothetical protein BDZ99DRAFT_485052 [Mytilinidion resinicola]
MRLASAETPSMADQLPSINFGFEELRLRMAQFTARFDDFIDKGRKRVLEERNNFRMNVAELQEDQKMKKRDIEILTLKSATHAQTLAKESAETAEMHAAITTLTEQRDERLANRDTLKAQIVEVQKAVSARREAQLKHRRYLDGQARHNEPELDFWENYLSMKIDGAGLQDRIKFTFNNINEREWEREAWFEIDTSEREVRVIHYRPKIEKEEVDRVQERYNECREFSVLLKGMRELFIEALK